MKGGRDRELLHGPISTMLEKSKTKDLSTKVENEEDAVIETTSFAEATPEQVAAEEKLRRDLKEKVWRDKGEDAYKHKTRSRIIMVETLNNVSEVPLGFGMFLKDGGCYEVAYTEFAKVEQYAEAKHFRYITLKEPVAGLKPIKLAPKE